jgi:hypothetical protein
LEEQEMTKCCLATIVALSVFLSTPTTESVNIVAEVHSIVEMSAGCLIGGVQNHKWINANRFVKGLKGKQKFSLYTLKGPAEEITINKIVAQRDCGDEWSAESSSTASEGIAIASPSWNVMPRLPRPVDLKDTTYVSILRDILKKEGIRKPEVKITQAYKIDLDGDGKDEVIPLNSCRP